MKNNRYGMDIFVERNMATYRARQWYGDQQGTETGHVTVNLGYGCNGISDGASPTEGWTLSASNA